MANVKDDDVETLDFADESDYIEQDQEDEVLHREDTEFEITSWPASFGGDEPSPFWRETYHGLAVE